MHEHLGIGNFDYQQILEGDPKQVSVFFHFGIVVHVFLNHKLSFFHFNNLKSEIPFDIIHVRQSNFENLGKQYAESK